MEIKRDLYLSKLITRKHNGLIKVVTGIRRCGKSYLLNTLFYNHLIASGVPEDHIIKFAFDSADDLLLIGENLIKLEKSKKRVDPEKFMAYIRSKVVDNQMYYLLLDEVQLLDYFESVYDEFLKEGRIAEDNMYDARAYGSMMFDDPYYREGGHILGYNYDDVYSESSATSYNYRKYLPATWTDYAQNYVPVGKPR